MPADRYRVTSATIAVFFEGGREVAGTVPSGAILTIDDAAFKGERLVNVMWDGREIMMFAADLRKRTTRVTEASA